MTTYEEIYRANGLGAKVIVDGNVWEISWVSPGGRRVHLRRDVRVKGHWHRMNYRAGGWRRLMIERPIDAEAKRRGL